MCRRQGDQEGDTTWLHPSLWIGKASPIESTTKTVADKLSKGGAVDKNMAATYKAAKAVGIDKIDAYMFPCKASQLLSKPPLMCKLHPQLTDRQQAQERSQRA